MPSIEHKLARLMVLCYPFRRGQGAIIEKTKLRQLSFQEKELLVRTLYGFDINVFPNDHIGRHLYLSGQFERTIIDVLLHFLRPDDRFLDIGANIGYVSCAILHAAPNVSSSSR